MNICRLTIAPVLLALLAGIAPLTGQTTSPAIDSLYALAVSEGPQSVVDRMRAIENNRPDDVGEAPVNTLGYRLLGEGRFAAAIAVLRRNTERFPDSPNTWDSLGDAFMQAGRTAEAIDAYRTVIERLPDAAVDAQTRTFLERNVRSRLILLEHPERGWETTAVRDFYRPDAEYPFGRLHPDAPPETEAWGQLAGIWRCINHAFVNGQWFSGWPATWVWRYTLDGFAVQDLWHQRIVDLPPTVASRDRDFVGTNLRIFDRVTGRWDVMWMHNGQVAGGQGNASSRLTARNEPDRIVMEAVGQGGPNRTRVVFHAITDSTFRWRRETSADSGATWTSSS